MVNQQLIPRGRQWGAHTPSLLPLIHYNGLFPLTEVDLDSDTDKESCNTLNFSSGLDSDSDPLIEIYVIGTEICPWDSDPSLKWVQ